MEWSKIKTMFIYLFLVLNFTLLFFYIYTIKINNTEIYQEKDAIIKSIKNDNIEIIEPKINKDNLSYISASVYEFKDPSIKIDNYNYELLNNVEGTKLYIKLENSITNIKNNNYKDELDMFIINKLENGFNYIFDRYDEKNNIVIYRQVLENIKIYNDNATIIFNINDNGDIKTFTQSALIDIKKDISENIVNYNQAIYKLYHENYIPRDSKVFSSLGYYTSASKLKNQVLIPVWRIEVVSSSDRKYYYVDAINVKILDKNNN